MQYCLKKKIEGCSSSNVLATIRMLCHVLKINNKINHKF